MMKSKFTDIESFFKTTKDDFEKKLPNIIQDKSIAEMIRTGKRLRPLLAQLAFKTCTGGKETPYQYGRSLEVSVSVELAHTASLIHDDIIDEDKERRGKPAFYIKEGIPNALLTGHKMLAKGFNIALNHGEKASKLYVETWDEILNGELKEVNFDQNKIKNGTDKFSAKSKFFTEYNKIINMKTASLFSSACKAGAIEAEASGEILEKLSKYGREIGLAYQLADDLVDLEHGEMIDSVIIPLLTRLEQKKVTSSSLKVKAIEKTISKNFDKIKEMYLEEIKKHVDKAERLSKSETIPSSPYKTLLNQAPKYIINAMLKEINIQI